SILGNGQYYQIGAEAENTVALSLSPSGGVLGSELGSRRGGILGLGGVLGSELAGGVEGILGGGLVENASAEEPKTALVKGNYISDPSLPSLIVIPSSVPTSVGSGGIFSPNVAFVTNGSTTNLVSSSTGYIMKKDSALKNMDSSLVGYWDMETLTSSGLLKDLSGNKNDGVGSGGVVIGGTGGIYGKGTDFDGIDDFIRTNTFLLLDLPNASFSINFKAKINDTSKSTQTFFDISPSHIGIDFVYNHTCKNGKYTSYLSNSGSWNIKSCGYGNTDKVGNYWHDYLITYDKDKKRYTVIIDGINDFTMENIAQLGIKNSILNLGHSNATIAEYIKGTIDDFKIYSRALSDLEIRQQKQISGF
ncbi:MAG: hypothetical protein PHH70_01755, partial [Candidatus Gracilibacteria bacterium]|nr:hypothetical protein [Candidatus Gracilibacteria bacterium]